ncbi:MAG: alpha/beta hydrolase [Flavobacteriales bacterium]|nr:alpha/beta hydrolase [Flavobacteriales bacterium]
MVLFDRTVLFISVIGLLTASCNVVHVLERKAIRKLNRVNAEDHLFHTPGGDRFVRATNSGKPKLVLVHGIGGSSTMWAGNAHDLSDHFDLVLPDLIGHGRSTKTWSGFSVDAQVEHLRLLLDSLGIQEPVDMVGCSYGGGIVANFAEQHPDRIKTLVIYDGPASDYTSSMADSIARATGATDIIDLFTPDNADELKRIIALAWYKKLKIPHFALRQMNNASKLVRGPWLDLLKDLRTHGDEFTTKVYNWPMPVYLIWGEEDKLIPLSVGKAIAARNHLPPDHLIVIPEAGHTANVEQPDLFEQRLLEVLSNGDR